MTPSPRRGGSGSGTLRLERGGRPGRARRPLAPDAPFTLDADEGVRALVRAAARRLSASVGWVIVRPEHRQQAHRVRLEWGVEGAALLAAECAAVVVVDVLSFCTAVDVAVGRGAAVLPQRTADAAAAVAAGAAPAGDRRGPGPSLRPSSLAGLAAGTRLALASPNGATLCAAVGPGVELFAGCLRNASAVAAALRGIDGPIGLVPAGERWPGGTMRVAVEDAIGAGAIAAALAGPGRPGPASPGPGSPAPGSPAPDPRGLSAEAEAAVDLFLAARARGRRGVLAGLASGLELVGDGCGADVDLAAALDVSAAAPRMRDGLLS